MNTIAMIQLMFYNTKKYQLWNFAMTKLSLHLTQNFSDYMMRYKDLYYSLSKKCKAFLPDTKEPIIILDVGSGPGLLTTTIQKNIPKATVIGIEPSTEMIQTIKVADIDGHFLLSQAERLPIQSNSTDLVVSRYSLPYWKEPSDGIKEIHRVLKPGGRVLFEALNKEFPKWRLLLIKYHMKLKGATTDVIKYHVDVYKFCYTYDQIKKLLIKQGLRIIHYEYKKQDWRFLIVAEKPQG